MRAVIDDIKKQGLQKGKALLPLKLIWHFEQNTKRQPKTAEATRDQVDACLDWMTALLAHVDLSLIANTFFQAAVYFQTAAQLEQDVATAMADEGLALQL